MSTNLFILFNVLNFFISINIFFELFAHHSHLKFRYHAAHKSVVMRSNAITNTNMLSTSTNIDIDIDERQQKFVYIVRTWNGKQTSNRTNERKRKTIKEFCVSRSYCSFFCHQNIVPRFINRIKSLRCKTKQPNSQQTILFNENSEYKIYNGMDNAIPT